MSTSAYNLDVTNPQYRDLGCPSQCMGSSSYSTLKDVYTFGTDPETSLMAKASVDGPKTLFNPMTKFGSPLMLGNTIATKYVQGCKYGVNPDGTCVIPF
jgi:hypothetical protein